jgi:hypothetical protein
MSFLPALGLRGRILVLAILPAAAILTVALGLNYLRMRTLLLDFGQEILRDRVRAIAADIDRETAEAVTTARVMAIAAENGMLDDRLQALRFTRDVLDSMPQFVGSYFGYEPDADGLDATAARAVDASSTPTRLPSPAPQAVSPGCRPRRSRRTAAFSPTGFATAATARGSCSSRSSNSTASTTRAASGGSSTAARSTRRW